MRIVEVFSHMVALFACDCWHDCATDATTTAHVGRLCVHCTAKKLDAPLVASLHCTLIICSRLLMPQLLLFCTIQHNLINAQYHFNTDADYTWITEQLMACTAATGGKVVSVLEGGYSLDPKQDAQATAAAAAAASAAAAGPRPRRRASETEAAAANNNAVAAAAAAAAAAAVPKPAADGGLARGVRAHVTALMQGCAPV
jgi:hypothetical protein